VIECATGMGEVRIADDRPRDAGPGVSLLATAESWGSDRLRVEWPVESQGRVTSG
jgi:hypothetical protein